MPHRWVMGVLLLSAGLLLPATTQAEAPRRPPRPKASQRRPPRPKAPKRPSKPKRPKLRKATAARKAPLQTKSVAILHSPITWQRMRARKDKMEKSILKGRDPRFAVVPRHGVQVQVESPGSGGGKAAARLKVSNVGEKGELNATLLAPVHGAGGVASAKNQAQGGRFTLSYQHGDGPRQPIIADAQSSELVTEYGIMIPLSRTGATRVFYERSGQKAEVMQAIEIRWDGQ